MLGVATLRRPSKDTPAPHLTRSRAVIEHHVFEDMYYHATRSTQTTLRAGGPSLTSMLPDGTHAPVIDIDAPVSVSSHPDGAAVTVTSDLDPVLVRKHLQVLVDAGLVCAESLTRLADAAPARRWWRRRKGWIGQVTVVLPFKAVAVPSKTPTHFHLLVQTSMRWSQACVLLRELAAAGIVDFSFAAISTYGDYMYVNCPPGEYDTI